MPAPLRTSASPARPDSRRRAHLLAAVLGLAAVPQAFAQLNPERAIEAFAREANDPAQPFKPADLPPTAAWGIDPGIISEKSLDAFDQTRYLIDDEARALAGDPTLRIGVERELRLMLGDGRWLATPDGGRIWCASVRSPGALGLRLRISGLDLPPGARLSVHAPHRPDAAAGPYEGNGPRDGASFWTGVLPGEVAQVEIFLPRGVELPGENAAPMSPFVIDTAAHLYRLPGARAYGQREAECHLDVTCYEAWASTALSVARVLFQRDGQSLVCSGTLLNNNSSDDAPLWLTANHCIATQEQASSAQILWRFQSQTCDGNPPDQFSLPRSDGCTLLVTQVRNDFTLLRIDGVVPRTGVTYAGWSTANLASGTPIVSISHPRGTYKRIAFGTRQSQLLSCASTGLEGGMQTNWTNGLTEPGSSGSAAFRDSSQQVVGVLSCGDTDEPCIGTVTDAYGRFSEFYPQIQTFLSGGLPDDNLEANDSCAAARLMPAGQTGQLVVKNTDEDWYRWTVQTGGTLTITASFTDANGDVDLELYSACGVLIGSSLGTGNSESVSVTNFGPPRDYILRVYLADDVHNTYTLNAEGVCCNAPMLSDFSGDERADILWHNRATGEAVAWACDGTPGDGTYITGSVPIPGASGGWQIVGKGDFNSDGHADIIWRNARTGQNTVWHMQGGTVQGVVALPAVADQGWRIVGTGDFNPTVDNHDDLIWHNLRTGELTVWFLNGAGAVIGGGPISTVSNTAWRASAVADMNGDGRSDVLWRNLRTGQLLLWTMNGTTVTGNVSITTSFTSPAWRLADVARFTDDTPPDILWRSSLNGDVRLLRMNNTSVIGTFAIPGVTSQDWRISGEQPVAHTVRDFDSNGSEDIVWRRALSNSTLVWTTGATLGSVAASTTLPILPSSNFDIQAIGDLNADCWPDLFIRNAATGANIIRRMNGFAVDGETTLPSVTGPWQVYGCGDIDGNGVQDLYWRNTATGDNTVWLLAVNSSLIPSLAGSLALPAVSDTNWTMAAVADFSRDGSPDILWRNTATGDNVVWVMNGAVFASAIFLPAVADQNWTIGKAADFDRDGDIDILWRNTATGSNSLWIMNGTAYGSAVSYPAVSDTAWRIAE